MHRCISTDRAQARLAQNGGRTIVLVVPVHQRAHLVVPQLDGAIVQRRREEGLLRVCRVQRRVAGGKGEAVSAPELENGSARADARNAIPLTRGLFDSNCSSRHARISRDHRTRRALVGSTDLGEHLHRGAISPSGGFLVLGSRTRLPVFGRDV